MAELRAHRVVLAAVDDIFFLAKIQSTAEHLGIAVAQARNAKELSDSLAANVPDLIVFDLHCTACDPFGSVARIRSDERLRATRVIGFFSHVQRELGERARESGFDLVLPRSRFSAGLRALLGDAGTT